MARKKISSPINKEIYYKVEKKLLKLQLNDEFIIRMRWVLFVVAFLLLFVSFQVGDDWFVRKEANYDWARSIGYFIKYPY